MPATLIDSDAKSANGGTVTSKAFAMLSGDLIVVAALGGYTEAANMVAGDGSSPPDGGGTFTAGQVGNTGAAPPQNCGLRLALRTVTADGSYTFAGSSTNETVLFVAQVRGQHSSPIDGSTVTATGQGTGLQNNTAPSISPAGSDDLLIYVGGLVQFVGATTWTPPTGMAELADLSSPNTFLTGEFAIQTLAASGATGPRTANSTRASGDTINGQARAMVAIRSAPAASAQTGRMFLSSP